MRILSHMAFKRTSAVEIGPKGVLVAAGNTLELNCTISGFPPNVTSDLVYFRPERPAELGGQRVDVIDHVTARLRYPDVKRSESIAHVWCYVGPGREYWDQMVFSVAGRLIHSHWRCYGGWCCGPTEQVVKVIWYDAAPPSPGRICRVAPMCTPP